VDEPLDVAYLGPAGTFSEEAVVRHLGASARGAPCPTIDDVFSAVEAKRAARGVVPVENSLEGAVGRTLDLLVVSKLHIAAEIALPIRQHLLRREASLAGIERVYGHPQSLAQCRRFLGASLPDAERVEVSSNAEAARRASREAGAAALAGLRAASIYALSVVAEGIEDDPSNTTRFLVIGHERPGPTGKDKTSIAMSSPNRPGSMVALLRPLSKNGVSMTKLESRPSRRARWDYVFFVDVEGHADDAHVRQALAEIDARAGFLKVLGSYPMAGA
jgi:chorismate mutase / prephenate dehydratase